MGVEMHEQSWIKKSFKLFAKVLLAFRPFAMCLKMMKCCWKLNEVICCISFRVWCLWWWQVTVATLYSSGFKGTSLHFRIKRSLKKKCSTLAHRRYWTNLLLALVAHTKLSVFKAFQVPNISRNIFLHLVYVLKPNSSKQNLKI